MASHQYASHRSGRVPGLEAPRNALRRGFKTARTQVRQSRRGARCGAGVAAPPVRVPQESDVSCGAAVRPPYIAAFLAYRLRFARGIRMTRYAVRHATVYEYGGEVSHSHHLLHLKPRDFVFQRCLGHTLVLDPPPKIVREDIDAFGNAIARLEYDRAHDSLAVTADMQVDVIPRVADSLESEPWETVRSRLSYHAVPLAQMDLEACRFRMRSSHVLLKRVFEDYARECFARNRTIAAASKELMSKIHREFKYSPGSTNNRTSVVDVLNRRRGVCQDFAHLMIA